MNMLIHTDLGDFKKENQLSRMYQTSNVLFIFETDPATSRKLEQLRSQVRKENREREGVRREPKRAEESGGEGSPFAGHFITI